MTTLNVPLTPSLEQWVGLRVAGGGYLDAADYVRDLVRRDQAMAEDDTEWLKAMIDEGLASGVIDKDAKDVLREIMAERPSRRD